MTDKKKTKIKWLSFLVRASKKTAEKADLRVVAGKIDYKFRNSSLLRQTLTHRSCLADDNTVQHNERLEHFGDAVLQLIITEALFNKFANADEGILTKLRSNLVSSHKLSEIAESIELKPLIYLGKSMHKTQINKSILANTFEALVGAVYLDSDFETCRKVVLRLYKPHFAKIDAEGIAASSSNPKSQLQEYLQAQGHELPRYSIVTVKSIDKQCKVSCEILDKITYAEGANKREAERLAAEKMLALISEAHA